MKYIAIIPARYASTRFPGKPLADMGGKIMIQRVYEQVAQVIPEVWVATDDDRICAAVKAFGGNAIMTSVEHRSGTDRIYEAYTSLGKEYDVIVNIQGDEPFVNPEQIQELVNCFDSPNVQIATLVKPFKKEEGIESLFNPNSPKVVINKNDEAIYFSRSVVPYLRDSEKEDWLKNHTFYKHLGLYAYRPSVLEEITKLEPSVLEKAESLEQLRWIENGYKIKVGYTDLETMGIDTPEDMERALSRLSKNKDTLRKD